MTAFFGFRVRTPMFFFVLVFVLAAAAAPALGASSSDQSGSQQCWTRKEPKIESEYDARYAGQAKNHSFTYTANSCTMTVATGDGKTFTNTITWSTPPAMICKGQEFEMNMNCSSEMGGAPVCGGFRGQGTLVASMRDWLKQRTVKLKYEEKPVVEASAGTWVGTGEIPYASVRVIWEYEEGGAGGGAKPPARVTSYCDADRDRAMDLSLKARLVNLRLAMLRDTIRKLDLAWSDQRDTTVFNASVDIAFLAVPGFTSTPAGQIVESGMKGIIKAGVKQWGQSINKEGLSAWDAAVQVIGSGARSAGKKAWETGFSIALFSLFYEQWRNSSALDKWIQELPGNLPVGGNVDAPLPEGFQASRGSGGEKFRENFVAPWVSFASKCIALEAVASDMEKGHNKIELIRQAIGFWRDEEIAAAREFDRLVQDLDVARYAYEYCLKLHPEERGKPIVPGPEVDLPPRDPGTVGRPETETGRQPGTKPQTPPRGDRTSTGISTDDWGKPIPPTTGKPPVNPGTGQQGDARTGQQPETKPPAKPRGDRSSTTVSAGLLNLSLQNGEWVVTSVPPGSIYEVEGLVAGAILITVDEIQVKGRSADQLRAMIKTAAGGDPKILGFQLPNGSIVHVPLY